MFNILLKLFKEKVKSAILVDIEKDKTYYHTLPPEEVKNAMIDKIQSKKHIPGEIRRFFANAVRSCSAETSEALIDVVKSVVRSL